MKIKLQIKNRWTGIVIFEYEKENNTLRKTVEEYIRQELASGKYYADLTDADLLQFKSDIWRVLFMSKNEVQGLRKALVEGKVNGSVYEGLCACLKGTIANVRGCSLNETGFTRDSSEPGEQWFLQIQEGQTPENSNAVKLTVEWIDEFIHFLNV